MSDQQEIRKTINQKRNQLSQEQQAEYAQRAANYLIQSDFFKNAQHIAAYIKFGNEMDPKPILEKAFETNKKCYLPVIDPKEYGKMTFVEYEKNDPLIKNRFGILEPKYHPEKIIQPQDLDLVIVPLTAFDIDGNRIGTGGGYYDRAFAFIKQQPSDKLEPILCGLAYSFQEIPNFEPNPWDIPLDAIATEEDY